MRESILEKKAVAHAYSLGAKCIKLCDLSRRGAPDRQFVLRNGKIVFVEFKKRGEKATLAQICYHGELKKRGQSVWTIDNLDDFLLRFNALLVK